MRLNVSSSETFQDSLVDELRAISTGLVYEPVGTGGSEAAPLEQELNVIEMILRARSGPRPPWRGGAALGVARAPRPSRERALLSALRQGTLDPLRGRAVTRAEPGLDERAARAILARVVSIDRAARAAIRRIERNRRFRDTPMPTGSTLYESVDEPALVRLHALQRRSRRAAVAIRRGLSQAADGPPPAVGGGREAGRFGTLAAGRREVGGFGVFTPARRGGQADGFGRMQGSGRIGTFGRAGPGQLARAILGPKPEGVVRPLSALYERWVMVRVVEALRAAGLEGGSIHDALIRDERKGDWRDFDDDAAVTLGATANRIVRVRFEPWIHSRNVAVMRGDGLYRSGDAPHSWRPDMVLQIEDAARAARQAWSSGVPVVRAVIIIDAKLAPVLRMTHWQQVQKYRFIRASANDARVVRHVYIASPRGKTALPPDAATGSDSPEVLTLSPEPASRDETAASLERLAGSVRALL
ncbi:MAG: hypothetical protein ACREM1_16965 [Longimicrobiales bacterium]